MAVICVIGVMGTKKKASPCSDPPASRAHTKARRCSPRGRLGPTHGRRLAELALQRHAPVIAVGLEVRLEEGGPPAIRRVGGQRQSLIKCTSGKTGWQGRSSALCA